MRIQLALGLIVSLFVSCSFAATRHYYIAAEDVPWNYAPSGRNLLNGTAIPQPYLAKLQWPKTRFIEYTDNTFTVAKPQPEWLGILGPVIRAEVGDEIVVEFLNRSRRSHDMHPHGLRYDKNNEGSYYLPFGTGAQIGQGSRFTYHWFADAGSGPAAGQLSSVVWWYHSHVDPAIEINAGLLGPIIITAKGKAKANGSPKDVDREFIASFMIFNEVTAKPPVLFYGINGFIFGNLPGLTMKQGEKVRWYLLGMGNEIDLHTPHWHGKTVTDGKQNTDVVELLPGSMKTVDMLADNPGTWMFHCHVEDHMENGMTAVYTIYSPATRSCPVSFSEGDFWKDPDKSTLTVKNTSGKSITNLVVTSEMLLAPLDLRRPYNDQWLSDRTIAPGGEQTIERLGARVASAQGIQAWVFFPALVKYGDGTTWHPQSEGDCFGVIWRDQQHPEMPVLPPRQFEMKSD
ncbi:MAG TPA: multicopper oxidase domain-containing protein [Terriglobales bacterium]|nr:multicopper oxidase domain-containing protein [Terriglobales bacterium]